jgi:hypothetical protein
MNTATHWLIKVVLILAVCFGALLWKAGTRDASGATSPVPGAIAGVMILALLAMKPTKKKREPDPATKPLDKKGDDKPTRKPPVPGSAPVSKLADPPEPLLGNPTFPPEATPLPISLPISETPASNAKVVVENRKIIPQPLPKKTIMKPEPEPKPSALPFIDDEPFYEEVAREFESDSMKPGLWTKAFAEADGDKEKSKVVYIRLRVAQLLAAKEAELKELQRLEDERIRAEEEARLQAAKLEAAKLKMKEKEAELEKRRQLEEQKRLQEQKQRSEEEAEKDPAQFRKNAALRLKEDLESLACYPTRISKGKTYFYSFKGCTFYVSSDEILFILKVDTDLPKEILVSRKLGDFIEMTLGIWEPGVTGIIHLKNGTQFRLDLDVFSRKALSEWAKKR